MFESPLVGSNNVTLLKRIPVDKLAQDWENSFEIDIIDELNGHKEIYLYQCNETKLKFFAPFDITGSRKLYEQLQQFDWYYMPNKWEHQVALQNLSNYQKVLEVGCAFGSFVQAGIDAGLKIRGIELNEAAAKAAQEKNLPVECMDLQKFADLYPQSLDAVCSFQVLEHVSNPKSFIEWSLQTLKPNGKLILCVPNSESFLKYEYNLLDMPPHHMTQWSEFSFKALEKIFPIKIEKLLREPLAEYHVLGYLTSYGSHFYSIFPLSKLFFNRYTISVYEKILNAGIRKFLTGQSLYVEFRKLP